MGCAYKLTSPSNKSYVGVTKKTAQERFEKHKEHALGKRDAGALYSALRKYGPDTFTLEVLVVLDDWQELLELEKQLIQQFNTLSPNGYNIDKGGKGGRGVPYTEESLKRMSEGQKRRFRNPDELARLREQGKRAAAARSAKYADIWKSKRQEIELQKAAKRIYFKSEERRKIHSERMRLAALNPQVKERMRAAAKRRAQDPQWKTRMIASKKGKPGPPRTSEWNAHIADARRREWADPVMRAKRLKAFGYVEKLSRSSLVQQELFPASSSPLASLGSR